MRGKTSFKEVVTKYGERIGLGAAVVVMLVLCLWGLTSSVTVGKSDKQVDSDISSAMAKMGDTQTKAYDGTYPELTSSSQDLGTNEKLLLEAIRNRHNYVHRVSSEDLYKRNPEVLLATEMKAVPVRFAFTKYWIEGDYAYVVPQGGVAAPMGQPAPNYRDANAGVRGRVRQAQMGLGGAPPPGLPGGEAPPGAAPAPGPDGGMGMQPMGAPPEKEFVLKLNFKRINVNDLLTATDPLAEILEPVRGVMVVGCFPHTAQMEEIAKALKLSNHQVELLYKRMEIQRREIVHVRAADGTAVDHLRIPIPGKGYDVRPINPNNPDDGWVKVDLKHTSWLMSLATQLEQETDPYKSQLYIGRLAMHMLPKPQRGSLPDVVSTLPGVIKSLDKIRLADPATTAPPPVDPRKKEFDPFNPPAPPAYEAPGGTNPGGMGTAPSPDGGTSRPMPPGAFSSPPPPGPTPSGKGGPVAPDGGSRDGMPTGPVDNSGTPIPQVGWPEYCVIRFLDLDQDIRPGRTYEYRVRVILQNPNYGKEKERELANPTDAHVAELGVNGKWSEPTPRITFPDELFAYAHSAVDDYPPRDKNARIDERDKDRVAVQLHKWIDWVQKTGGKESLPVGEWWAWREMVGRGDYVGRTALRPKDKPNEPPLNLAPMIVWISTTRDPTTQLMGVDSIDSKFSHQTPLAADPADDRKRILMVDFEQGGKHRLQYPVKDTGKRPVDEEAPAELLMVDTQGRLIGRLESADKDNAKRKEQYALWRKWYDATKSKMDLLKGTANPNPMEGPKFDR